MSPEFIFPFVPSTTVFTLDDHEQIEENSSVKFFLDK